MLAFDKLQKAVARETGTEIRDFENAYIAENRMSSMNKAESEVFNRDFMKPLYKEVFDLMHDTKGCTRIDIDRYLKAKHGLERNEYFHEKLANEMGEKAEVEAHKKLAEEGKSEEEIEEGGEEARKEAYDTALEKHQKKDFSGLTELTEVEGEKNTEFTKRAEGIVDDFENRHDVKPLWTAIHVAMGESLKKSLKSGVISRKVYNQIKGMFDYYVSLRGWDKNETEKEYDYFGNGMSHEQHVWLHSWCQRCGW